MKKLVLALGLLVSSMALAERTTTLIGYLTSRQERGQIVYRFTAVNPREYSVTANYPLDFFKQEDADIMADCMAKKNTHVIFVDSVPEQQQSPTSIPGRYVTTHFPRLENARCLPSPGFIETWRDIIKRHGWMLQSN